MSFFVGLQQDTITNGENDIIFKHNIRLQTPKCNCEESESFKDLLYRINGLEEEVTYLKTQCTQGCCGRGSVAGKYSQTMHLSSRNKQSAIPPELNDHSTSTFSLSKINYNIHLSTVFSSVMYLR